MLPMGRFWKYKMLKYVFRDSLGTLHCWPTSVKSISCLPYSSYTDLLGSFDGSIAIHNCTMSLFSASFSTFQRFISGKTLWHWKRGTYWRLLSPSWHRQRKYVSSTFPLASTCHLNARLVINLHSRCTALRLDIRQNCHQIQKTSRILVSRR